MRVAALGIVLLAACAPALLAQSTSASLTGRVADASHARIAEAKVAAISTSTGVGYATTTSTSGQYSFNSLPPGAYRIEVEKPSFKKLIRPDVTLHVQDALEIDFEMQVGSASESVIVQGGAPLVDTESAAVSTVIDRDFVDNLPLNGRSFQTLILLTPGAVVSQTAFDDQGQFSVNGQRADGNYFTVDGVSANFGVTSYLALTQAGGGALPALTVSGGTNSLVSVDAMQEFRVQTSSFAPEFGHTPGGQISVVTRSGTNAFHGSAFDYFRNDVLDANDWFNGYTNKPALPKAKDRQNDFGGVLGGPIIKDAAFFFFSYEGLRLRQPATTLTDVPDSTSRTAAPAAMQPYLKAYPIPNGAEAGNGLAAFNGSYSDPSSLDAYSLRLDDQVNSKVTLFGRYDYSPSHLTQRGPSLGFEQNLSSNETLSASVQTFTLGMDELVNPRIGNEVRLNYSNDRLGTTLGMDSFGGAVPLPDSALFPSGYSSASGIFTLEITGAGEILQGKEAINEQRQVNAIDNVSLTWGSHQTKFGVDYRWLSPFSSVFAYRQFDYFTGLGTAVGGALSGSPALAAILAYDPDALVSHNFSLYGQDTWKASRRLSLMYGLRWDVNPPLKGTNLANDPYTVTGLNDPTAIALAPRGTPLYNTTYGNVAPRVGIAYQLGGGASRQSVLRGGFGVFYDLGTGSLGAASSYFPFDAERVLEAPAFPLSPQNAAPPTITGSLPAGTIIVAEPNLKLPRTYEWNAAVEQSLGSSQSVSLTYVGAVGRDLLRVTDLVSPNANFGFVGVTDNSATSNYQALQAKFERRLLHGLQALASYNWSHSIDIASTDAFANYLNTPTSVANSNIDRGDSDFDIRNSFTAGVTYALPSPESNALVRETVGGWSVDSFILARSAPPVDVIGGQVFADGIALYPRPNVVPGVPQVLHGSQYPGGRIFNVAAFTAPPTGQQGDFGRNVLRGFGAAQADIALQREFRFTEKVGLRFRGESFNLLNHPNFGPPDNNITDALFGQSTQTLASSLGSGGANGGLNPLYQVGGPRSIQLALKLGF